MSLTVALVPTCLTPAPRCSGWHPRVRRFSVRAAVQCDRSGALRVCPHGGCGGVFFTDTGAGDAGSGPRANGCITPCPACSKGVCLVCASPDTACSCDGTMVDRLNEAGIELRCCPRCGAPAMKNSGCERMKCLPCGCNWDWDRGQRALSATALYTGVPRSRWEWARMAMMLAASLVLVQASRSDDTDAFWRATLLVAAAYVAAEGLLSRATTVLGTHLCAVLMCLGCGLVLHGSVDTLADFTASCLGSCIPAVVRGWLTWLCPGFVSTAAWFLWQWGVWLTASATSWVVLGASCVVVVGEWGPAVRKMCSEQVVAACGAPRRLCGCCMRHTANGPQAPKHNEGAGSGRRSCWWRCLCRCRARAAASGDHVHTSTAAA